MWIHRIHMFLGLPDPDPLVRGVDTDPSIIPLLSSKIVRNTLILTVLWLLLDFLSLKTDVNVPSKSNKQKNFVKNIIFLLASWSESPDPDPHQNVMESGTLVFVSIRILGIRRVIHISNFSCQSFKSRSEKCLNVDVIRFKLQHHFSLCLFICHTCKTMHFRRFYLCCCQCCGAAGSVCFLGLLDPDPDTLVRGPAPDPSIIKQI